MTDKSFDDKLKKDIETLARDLEAGCQDPDEPGMSPEKERELFAMIGQQEKELEQKRKERHRKLRGKRRLFWVLAAAMVLVLGMGMSAIGDRAWETESKEMAREEEISTKVDNEDKEDVLLEEEEIYQEIEEKLGIAPMWLGHVPEGMILDDYEILENIGVANMYYTYDDDVIRIIMSKKSLETSSNIQFDGKVEKIDYKSKKYQVEAYCLDRDEKSYSANIEYANGYYSIIGIFDKEEFIKILDEIYFKTV